MLAGMVEGPVWITIPYWSRKIPHSFAAKCCHVPSRHGSEAFRVHWTLYRSSRWKFAIILPCLLDCSPSSSPPLHLMVMQGCWQLQTLVSRSEHVHSLHKRERAARQDSPRLGVVREGTLLLPQGSRQWWHVLILYNNVLSKIKLIIYWNQWT